MIANCYSAGTVNTAANASIAGDLYDGSGSIENCYYDSSVYTGGDVTKGVTAKTPEQFASGEVAHLLQGSQSGQVWGQDITSDTKDSRPILSADAGKKVLKVTFATQENASYAAAYTNTGKTVTLPNAPTADVGSYTVTFDVLDSDPFVLFSALPNTAAVSTELSLIFEIGKATPQTITFPTVSAITYGDTLSDSDLTGGAGDGAFAWEDGDTVPAVENVGFTMIFTPNDAESYDYLAVEGYDAVTKTVKRTMLVSVSPRTVAVVWPDTTGFTYDGQEKTVTATVNNIVGNDAVPLTISGNTGINSGYFAKAFG